MSSAKDIMIEAIDINKEYRRAGAIIRALVDINLKIKSGQYSKQFINEEEYSLLLEDINKEF